MISMDWRSIDPIGLAGGAPASESALGQVSPHVREWVAVDGGADLLLREGITPRAVLGDLDSISKRARRKFSDILHEISEQETTDFEKALSLVQAPLIFAVGFTGGRFDHELAVMNALVRYPEQRCIVLGEHTLVFHCPQDIRLYLPKGALVSLFPLRALRVRSEGLNWPTDGLEFAPDGRIGTSNHSVAPMVRLRPDGAGMLVILTSEALGPAVAALAGQGRERRD